MSTFIVTEVRLYKIDAKDKDEALTLFGGFSSEEYLVDVEVKIEPNYS
jgi:hypothetical protein